MWGSPCNTGDAGIGPIYIHDILEKTLKKWDNPSNMGRRLLVEHGQY